MENKILELLKDSGAFLEGHFLLTSGKHSNIYIEKFRLMESPKHLDTICKLMAGQFNQDEVQMVELDYLVANSEFITLHLPINDNTRDLFNYSRIKQMKKTARLINVARGGIINENDLSKALNEELIAGAAIDVFVEEPLSASHELIKCKNILLTPHLGASTVEAKEGVTEGTKSFASKAMESFKKGEIRSGVENVQ